MRKFKHKTLETVAEKRGDLYHFNHSWGGSYIPKEFIETSDDWEEIIEKEVLLTTEDGVEIYGGEKLHLVTKCFTLGVGLNFTKDDLKNKDYLFFAEKENAERFINLNKPQYSIKDIVPIVNNWSMSGIDEDDILNFLARK